MRLWKRRVLRLFNLQKRSDMASNFSQEERVWEVQLPYSETDILEPAERVRDFRNTAARNKQRRTAHLPFDFLLLPARERRPSCPFKDSQSDLPEWPEDRLRLGYEPTSCFFALPFRWNNLFLPPLESDAGVQNALCVPARTAWPLPAHHSLR